MNSCDARSFWVCETTGHLGWLACFKQFPDCRLATVPMSAAPPTPFKFCYQGSERKITVPSGACQCDVHLTLCEPFDVPVPEADEPPPCLLLDGYPVVANSLLPEDTMLDWIVPGAAPSSCMLLS